jgi:hypothetical protein
MVLDASSLPLALTLHRTSFGGAPIAGGGADTSLACR